MTGSDKHSGNKRRDYMKIYVVKTTRLNEYIANNGFKMIRPQRDRYNSSFVVFLYEDTDELRECIGMYKK